MQCRFWSLKTFSKGVDWETGPGHIEEQVWLQRSLGVSLLSPRLFLVFGGKGTYLPHTGDVPVERLILRPKVNLKPCFGMKIPSGFITPLQGLAAIRPGSGLLPPSTSSVTSSTKSARRLKKISTDSGKTDKRNSSSSRSPSCQAPGPPTPAATPESQELHNLVACKVSAAS